MLFIIYNVIFLVTEFVFRVIYKASNMASKAEHDKHPMITDVNEKILDYLLEQEASAVP